MVAEHLLAAPEQAHYGYDICRALGLRGGLLYPLLERLHNAGWLADRWEDPGECLGRPPRRYYLLTSAGVDAMTVIAHGDKPPAPVPQGADGDEPSTGGVNRRAPRHCST